MQQSWRVGDDPDRYDEPEGFEEFQRAIRTRDGDAAPAYRMGYRMAELTKLRAAFQRLGKRAEMMNWVERGPVNVSGRTRGLMVDVSDAERKTWLAGTAGGGIWKTTDAGATWKNTTADLPNLATTTLAQSASSPAIVYAGTGEGYLNVGGIRGDGLFKSTDHGETWQAVSSTSGNGGFSYVNSISIHPQNPNNLIVATNSGIFVSHDGGLSWQQTFSGRAQSLVANPQNPQTLYLGVNGMGVYRSTDRGKTWLARTSSIGDGYSFGRVEVALAPNDTTHVYAAFDASYNSNHLTRLWVSRDATATWATLMATSNTETNWLGDQGWYDHLITVNPSNKNEVIVGGIDLVKLTIQGSAFSHKHLTNAYGSSSCLKYFISSCNVSGSSTDVHPDQHQVVAWANSKGSITLLAANDGGVYVSEDNGGNWRSTASMPTTQFYSASKKTGTDAYLGGTQDNGTWMTGDNPLPTDRWKQALGGDGFGTVWHASNPNWLIGSLYYNDLRVSKNGGVTWASVSGIGDSGSGNANFVTRIAYNPLSPDVLLVGGVSGVWKSTDFGTSWKVVLPGSPWGKTSARIETSLSDPKIVWAGSGLTGGRIMYVSRDQGETYQAVQGYTKSTIGTVTSLATHPFQDSTAYALYSVAGAPKILRTEDLGKTWEDISQFEGRTSSANGFPDVAVYALLVLPHQPNTIWAGTEIGLVESTDNGKTWHMANNGLPAAAIWDMEVVDDEIVIATHGRGIWSLTVPEIAGALLYPIQIQSFGQDFPGAPMAKILFRSAYDSVHVAVNQKPYQRYGATTQGQTATLNFQGYTDIDLRITGYRNGKAIETTQTKTGLVFTKAVKSGYATNFEQLDETDFYLPVPTPVGGKFSIQHDADLGGKAIHTAHPVQVSVEQTYYYTLAVPIKVSANEALSYVEFDEIALITPDVIGKKYPDPDFGNFVTVEGSWDGTTWRVLSDGVNAQTYPDWLTAQQNSQAPTKALFKHRKINLLRFFNAGMDVMIRFKITSVASRVSGWGWVVDNLEIQQRLPVANETEENPSVFTLLGNFPNPFNPSTQIKFRLAKPETVKLDVFDLGGRKVASLRNEPMPAGEHVVRFEAAGLPSGLYLYRVQAGQQVQTRKMLLLK